MSKQSTPGFGRLLDAWTPPDGAGEPVGCLATSFTFDAVFFEEECLGRFLRLETDPTTDGALYLLEREEKLAQLSCASALVDRHHCRGSRSLRWDLVPVHVAKGILHAKVGVLLWADHLRLIVASANLTEDGYRRNQEVFATLDFRPQDQAPVACLTAIADFLAQLLSDSVLANPNAVARARGLLTQVARLPVLWGVQDTGQSDVAPVLVGPGRPSAVDQLAEVWPAGVMPSRAVIVSPFFDRDADGGDRPAQAVWRELMRKRGPAELRFRVPVEPAADGSERLVRAPETVRSATPPGRREVATRFDRLLIDDNRPLHAKTYWFEDDRWRMYLMGSSNFTTAGLGLGTANVEANLAFVVDAQRDAKKARELQTAFPPGEALLDAGDLRWLPLVPDGEDEPAVTDLSLPLGFRSAEYRVSPDGAEICLVLKDPPAGWALRDEMSEAVWLEEEDWQAAAQPQQIRRPWEQQRPPSGFWVAWAGATGRAWLPVTVESATSLPPPEELRALPLEVLIDVLTSSRPLHRIEALRRHLRRRERSAQFNVGDVAQVDPHRRVDTSGFLLQRTRRVSWALRGLRERLERPVLSIESLWWRLRGPVGVMALAEALQRESHSSEETAFLITELLLELHRVQPDIRPGYVEPDSVKAAVREVMHQLQERVPENQRGSDTLLGGYIDRVFGATQP